LTKKENEYIKIIDVTKSSMLKAKELGLVTLGVFRRRGSSCRRLENGMLTYF
jgi:hypothetical protein